MTINLVTVDLPIQGHIVVKDLEKGHHIGISSILILWLMHLRSKVSCAGWQWQEVREIKHGAICAPNYTDHIDHTNKIVLNKFEDIANVDKACVVTDVVQYGTKVEN